MAVYLDKNAIFIMYERFLSLQQYIEDLKTSESTFILKDKIQICINIAECMTEIYSLD